MYEAVKSTEFGRFTHFDLQILIGIVVSPLVSY